VLILGLLGKSNIKVAVANGSVVLLVKVVEGGVWVGGGERLMSSEMDRASELLSWAGVRLMEVDGVVTVRVWSDLNCLEIRDALRVLGSGDAPVRYLDGSGIPDRYKLRRVAGDPVPMSVLRAMEQHPEAPLKVRDELLVTMRWPGESSWNAWVRRRNDRIFSRDVVSHEPDVPEAWPVIAKPVGNLRFVQTS
jgi:hypothetical protein